MFKYRLLVAIGLGLLFCFQARGDGDIHLSAEWVDFIKQFVRQSWQSSVNHEKSGIDRAFQPDDVSSVYKIGFGYERPPDEVELKCDSWGCPLNPIRGDLIVALAEGPGGLWSPCSVTYESAAKLCSGNENRVAYLPYTNSSTRTAEISHRVLLLGRDRTTDYCLQPLCALIDLKTLNFRKLRPTFEPVLCGKCRLSDENPLKEQLRQSYFISHSNGHSTGLWFEGEPSCRLIGEGDWGAEKRFRHNTVFDCKIGSGEELYILVKRKNPPQNSAI